MAEIKELMEVLEAAKKLSVGAIEKSKDGIGFEDISLFVDNIDAISKAIEGASAIPAELGDLDQAEIMQLASFGIAWVFEVMAALKKEEPVA